MFEKRRKRERKREEGRGNEVGLGGDAENENCITADVRHWKVVGFGI
jgi:hypothetical protein